MVCAVLWETTMTNIVKLAVKEIKGNVYFVPLPPKMCTLYYSIASFCVGTMVLTAWLWLVAKCIHSKWSMNSAKEQRQLQFLVFAWYWTVCSVPPLSLPLLWLSVLSEVQQPFLSLHRLVNVNKLLIEKQEEWKFKFNEMVRLMKVQVAKCPISTTKFSLNFWKYMFTSSNHRAWRLCHLIHY